MLLPLSLRPAALPRCPSAVCACGGPGLSILPWTAGRLPPRSDLRLTPPMAKPACFTLLRDKRGRFLTAAGATHAWQRARDRGLPEPPVLLHPALVSASQGHSCLFLWHTKGMWSSTRHSLKQSPSKTCRAAGLCSAPMVPRCVVPCTEARLSARRRRCRGGSRRAG